MFGVSPRLIAWLATLPLAVAGTQVAHSLAYRLTTPVESERVLELSATGHAYGDYVPLVLAIGAVVVAFALVAEVRRFARFSPHTVGPRAWHFAVVAPALFTTQEHLERFFHDGAFPWHAGLDATFVTGLLLQIPFAIAAYVFVRLLLGVARSLATLLARARSPRVRPTNSKRRPPRFHAPRLPALALGYGSRGPPILLVV
jgi:hypothetical protein